MGYHQTASHKNGKGSFHQIGLVRGQFGNVPFDAWGPYTIENGEVIQALSGTNNQLVLTIDGYEVT